MVSVHYIKKKRNAPATYPVLRILHLSISLQRTLVNLKNEAYENTYSIIIIDIGTLLDFKETRLSNQNAFIRNFMLSKLFQSGKFLKSP